MHAAGSWIAGIICAANLVVAFILIGSSYTCTIYTIVARCAIYSIDTGCAIWFNRIVAVSCRFIAYASCVALVRWSTNYGIRSCACTCLTGIGLSTFISVITGYAIRCNRIVASPCLWIAYASCVALVQWITFYRVRSCACTCLTGIGLSTGIVIITGCIICCIRIAASPCLWISYASCVALVQWITFYRVRSCACTRMTGIGLSTGIAVRTGVRVIVGVHAGACI
jgi:hypothetical protein